MKMNKRKHIKDKSKLPLVCGTGFASELLGVSPQTIRNACKRLGRGMLMTDTNTFLLTGDDLIYLDGELQTGSGNLTRSKG